MLKTKVIMSKRQTDFQNQVERFLNSKTDWGFSYDIQNILYSIAITGNSIYHSALIIYDDLCEGES